MNPNSKRGVGPRLAFVTQPFWKQAPSLSTGGEDLSPGALDPDRELVDRWQAGDASAFEGLIRRHERRVFAYLVTVLGSAVEAEDVLQQTCVVLWTRFGEFTPGSDFAAWAVRTAYLTARNHLRAKARSRVRFSQAMFEAAAERAAAQQTEADAVHDALGMCLAKLPPDDREIAGLPIGQTRRQG